MVTTTSRECGYFRVATAIPRVKISDCRYNAERAEAMLREAAEQGVEVVVFPELSISGYTCGDLFLHAKLLRSAQEELMSLVERCKELDVVGVVGVPLRVRSRLYNCAVVFGGGRILAAVPKQYIPNYSEFYESRWFASGVELGEGVEVEIGGESYWLSGDNIFEINGVKCAIEVCEDLWMPNPPSSRLSSEAEVIFNLSASPEVVGKHQYLVSLIEQQSARCMSAYVYASAGFGESSTDLVFAGNGIIAENGRVLAQAERFSLGEQLTVADIDVELLQSHRLRSTTFHAYGGNEEFFTHKIELKSGVDHTQSLCRDVDPMPFVPSDLSQRKERCEEIFAMQSSGLAQRLAHTGCQRVVVGISGGLDSTLALLVAVRSFDRLGLDRKGIIGVTMPGFGTTGRTYNNALSMMKGLGVTVREISIKAACMQHFEDIGLPDTDRSVSYENSQARERTQILMDIANMEGGLVIGTGDLSEMALGWATYNGDHMSMYGVNASVPKTLVRYLVSWVADEEERRDVEVAQTLRDVVDTPVSPELLPADENGDIAQKTEDLVGPYELHDFYLYHFVRSSFAPSKIFTLAKIAFGEKYDAETIMKWLRTFMWRFFGQQFKRSATPDAPKVGSVTLSPRGDWRMPSDATVAEWLRELE